MTTKNNPLACMRFARSSSRRLLPGLLLALGLGGCVEVIGIEDTEIEPGRDLACLGRVVPPPVVAGATVEIRAQIVDIGGSGEVPGVEVVRCNSRLGAACDFATPFAPDATGLVVVPVTAGFNGYLRILDADASDDAEGKDWVPYLWYFSQPINQTREEPFPIQAMTTGVREFLVYPETTVTQDPQYGDVAINAVDCNDNNAPNIHFEVTTPASEGPNTAPFYFGGGMVVIASALENEVTDETGLGGFRALEPGTMIVRAWVADTFNPEPGHAGSTLVAEDTLLIEADTLTTVRLLPE
ncbi:MAG: hypothetical protein KC593_11370 [Myxococcales bacterium]|nr:hypothetical protein [Myxococcales bacterium]